MMNKDSTTSSSLSLNLLRRWTFLFYFLTTCLSRQSPLRPLLRGPGGSEVYFHCLVVSDSGECQLRENFYEMKKYCS